MADQKNYIISIQATLKGDKVVLSGLKNIEGETKKFSQTVDVSGKKTQDFNDILVKAGQRALIVAPIWLAIRSAMMLAMTTIGDMVKANMDLEEAMSRIQTVMQGTAGEIEAQMAGIKRTILNTSLTTKVSVKDLGEAFYFLKTSALSSEEAMAGFQPVVNIITGTNVKAQESARALAGMYNTLGKTLGDNLTPAEKMTKIADILTYTYAKQDVEMGELMAGYSKLAPYVAGLDDNFVDIVSTLGFLNTHLLRSSRAGTLTGQAIINMTKSASQLASIFNITFDPNKPMNFLNTIDQIQKAMGDTSKLTEAQSEAIQKISATRGGVPLRLILGNYDEFKATLADASKNFEGFAKKIADIRMNTVTAQMAEMRNVLAVLTNDFISGVYGVGDFAQALKMINETMVAMRPTVKTTGNLIGWMGELIGRQAVSWDFLLKQQYGMLMHVPSIRGFGAYVAEQQKLTEESKKTAELRDTYEKISESRKEIRINALKEEREIVNNNVGLMKVMGANEVDILKYKVQSLETIREYLTEEDYLLEKQKTENELVREQVKYRKEITDNLRNVGLDLLKTMGTSEANMITMKMRELDVDRQQIGEASYMAQMEALRLQRIQAVVSEKLKEKDIQKSLILDYQKADETERGRIRRLIELRKLSTFEVGKEYEKSPFDAKLIEENLGKFSTDVQDMITKKFSEKYGFEYEDTKDIIRETSRDLPNESESIQVQRDLVDILTDLNTNIGNFNNSQVFGVGMADATKGWTIKDRIAVDANVDLRTAIQNINIYLPDDALDSVAKEAGKAVEEAMTSNEEIGRKIAKLIRPYL